jgi:RNA-directed DNA polymerase
MRETLKKLRPTCHGEEDMLTSGTQVKILFFSESMSNLAITWSAIDWIQTQVNVRKLQNRIYEAKLAGDTKRVQWLQKFLTGSLDARFIAVRQVTVLNKGKSTAGVDKQLVTTNEQRVKLALELKIDGYAGPIRRVWIPKPGKTEKRPLGIPTIKDRAKQALAKLALEPEWEAIFEPNSYGFRPGRGCHDAIEAIYLGLHHQTPKWVFDADIRKCFDRINHTALLEKLATYPEMKRQIAAWLKAGVMEGYANSPKSHLEYSHEGTPQGGVISPFLANIALHGLENHLKTYVGNLSLKPHPGSNRGKVAKQKALSVVRYADDFVLIHRNKEILELCMQETKLWLSNVGLEISEEKSALRDARNGFLFLGFQIILIRKVKVKTYKVKVIPSGVSQKRFLSRIRYIIQNNKAVSSYRLILMLRPIIIGWANYFRYCECKQVFSKLTNLIFRKLRAWVFRRDTRNGRLAVKQKYFPSGKSYSFYGTRHLDNWVLNGSQKSKGCKLKTNFLPQLVWVPSAKHVKVKGTESPFSMSHYWALRCLKHSLYPLRIRNLLVRQHNRCTRCKRLFDAFDSQTWEVDHIIPRWSGGKDTYDNLQLLHEVCHKLKTAKDSLNFEPVVKRSGRRRKSSSGQALQEPDEVKVSRPDLKTRAFINKRL